MKPMSIEDAAQLMGMKPHREVREVVATAAGHCALTHDGNWTLIRPDGSTQAKVPAPVALATGGRIGPMGPIVAGEPSGPAAGPGPVVPDGSIEAVMAWVNEVPDEAAQRADLALAAERAKETPRSTLVAALEKLKG